MSGLIFIIGAVIGSGLGAFISRRDNIKSFIFGRSVCEKCGKEIKFWNNIPILSYILLKGRCKNCHERINFSIFLIELVSGILSLICYKKYGLGLNLFIRILQIYLLILIAFTDINYKHIYSIDAYIVFGIELGYKILNKMDIRTSILASLILFLAYFLIYKLSGSMGFGDVIFGGVSGFFAKDFFTAFEILKYSFFIAAIISLLLIAFKLKNRRDPIAFCPYIALAIVGVIL